jgi:3-deoxy-7-phosphoheptulonate synthase
MIESNLVSGRQDHIQGHAVENLIYGQSITDACIDMDSSAKILQKLAIAVRQRKLNKENQG